MRGVPVTAACGRVAARLARQAEQALGEVDLSLPQYRIMLLLDEGSAVASRLADALAVSRPTVTSVVDGLVARNLVSRRHGDDGDRRRIGLSLTSAGRRLLDAADRAVDARLRDIAGHLGNDALVEDAMAGLDVWRTALDAHRAAKLGASEVGAAKLGASEVGAAKLGASEVGAAKLGASEVGAAKLGASEVGAAKLGAGSATLATTS